MIWYEVLGVVPEQLKPFDQVKDEVAKDWRIEEERTKVAKYAQDLVNSLAAARRSKTWPRTSMSRFSPATR